MKKKTHSTILGLLLMASLSAGLQAQEIARPFILVKPSDRQSVLEKIDSQEWAKKSYNEFIAELDQDIEGHVSNPGKFLREMPFDWDKARQGESPPFTYTIHINPNNGERTNLDNGTEEEMANARKLQRFLKIGLECGMAFYITQDEKYARCATDILNAFVRGVLQMERSDWRWRGGWLFPDDGFREVRDIGSRVPLIYDFVASYLWDGGLTFDLGGGGMVDFPLEETQEVFRSYADISINYGHTGSNHAILEAPSLVYNALAMDDRKERERLLSYFLSVDTENQDALSTMARNWKEEGDIWPETSQYLNHASTLLTRLMLIVNRYDPSLRLSEKYPNILYSLPALDYLIYPNGELIRWGDGHRYGRPSYPSYEEAYMLGLMDGNDRLSSTFGALLNRAISEGKYKRKGMDAVLLYGSEIKGESKPLELPRTDRVRHAGIFLQRNLVASGNPDDGLMCFVGGGPMVHGHAEGMNIELFGEGQVLGVDNGRGRYQQDVHENYSRIFAAHNTVIVNGSSRGDSGWVNQGINTVELICMEPLPGEEAVSPDYSFSQTSFLDDKGDKSEAVQERTVALIRTSPSTGYYVDVFRSKSKLPGEYHDYLYHNLGDRLIFKNKDLELIPTPDRFMANAGLPWKQNKQYRHPGWHFFKDVHTVTDYMKDLHVQFALEKFEDRKIYMDLYIPACKNRDYTSVMAPPTYEAPQAYRRSPTPTLIIRKKGEAWENPFVVVFEPFNEKEKSSIQEVKKLEQDGLYKGLKIVSRTGKELLTQYVLTQSCSGVYEDKDLGIYFKGAFALITLDTNGVLRNLYIGNGEILRYGESILEVDDGNTSAYAEYIK